MKTHADFKRYLQAEGTQLETLALANHISGGRLRVGTVRFVSKTNTVGVYLKERGDLGTSSFLDYGNASEWVFEGFIATNTKYGYSYRVIPTREDK